MMKKKIIITILALLLIFNLYPKDYINKALGIKFKVPDKVIITDDFDTVNIYSVLISWVNKNSKFISNFNFEETKNNLENHIISKNSPIPIIYLGFVKLKNNIDSEKQLYMGYDLYDAVIKKSFSFIYGDNYITIHIKYEEKNSEQKGDKLGILKTIKKYNEKSNGNNLSTEDAFILIFNDIDKYLKDKKKIDMEIPECLVEIENIYNQIVSTIDFFQGEKFSSILYTVKVDSLRLRSTPSTNGMVYRLLKKGEELELIEKGKEETINGVKGNWVKIRTIDSETGNSDTGWCFDAYLEGVK